MTDTCPSCLERDIDPIACRRRGPHLAHGYRCPACGHQWAVGRLATAYPPQYRKAA
jgi:transposase-like protein